MDKKQKTVKQKLIIQTESSKYRGMYPFIAKHCGCTLVTIYNNLQYRRKDPIPEFVQIYYTEAFNLKAGTSYTKEELFSLEPK